MRKEEEEEEEEPLLRIGRIGSIGDEIARNKRVIRKRKKRRRRRRKEFYFSVKQKRELVLKLLSNGRNSDNILSTISLYPSPDEEKSLTKSEIYNRCIRSSIIPGFEIDRVNSPCCQLRLLEKRLWQASAAAAAAASIVLCSGAGGNLW
jgi:hypothetical protein